MSRLLLRNIKRILAVTENGLIAFKPKHMTKLLTDPLRKVISHYFSQLAIKQLDHGLLSMSVRHTTSFGNKMPTNSRLETGCLPASLRSKIIWSTSPDLCVALRWPKQVMQV